MYAMDKDSRQESYTVSGNDAQLGLLLPALAKLICENEIVRFNLVMTGQSLTLSITCNKPTAGGRDAEIDGEKTILGKLRETGCRIK
jgi:hypothetical protein